MNLVYLIVSFDYERQVFYILFGYFLYDMHFKIEQESAGNHCGRCIAKGHGTLPDYIITPIVEDIILGKDVQLEKAMELLR